MYSFVELPRSNPAAALPAGVPVLGIEVTVPEQLELCDLGNVDGQHGTGRGLPYADPGVADSIGHGWRARAAIDIATEIPLPPAVAEITARLKAAVVGSHSNEVAAFATLQDAKLVASQAEHALCVHLKSSRGGTLKGVEVELDGLKYKPKFIDETKRYRLDRVLAHERVTI